MLSFLAANPFNIKAQDIDVPTSTPTISAGLANVVLILMALVGMTSVVFIIVGGLQMTASNGDPKRFARGRETVLYACVGVAIAIAAYAIVTFVSGIPLR